MEDAIHCGNMATEEPFIRRGLGKCPDCVRRKNKRKWDGNTSGGTRNVWNGLGFVAMGGGKVVEDSEEVGLKGEEKKGQKAELPSAGRKGRRGLRARGMELWKRFLCRVVYS